MVALPFLLVAIAEAQKTTRMKMGGGGSPHDRTEWTIDGANIAVEYGRPFAKGRKIVGGVVPYGDVWRTGADEATLLITDATLRFGALTLAPGKYSLWTLPGQKQWMLIVNKDTGQWGTTYNQKEDLGRVEMKVDKTRAPVDQLTISIDDTAGNGAVLAVEWENTRASVPFTVQK
jgi:hypothetical protein